LNHRLRVASVAFPVSTLNWGITHDQRMEPTLAGSARSWRCSLPYFSEYDTAGDLLFNAKFPTGVNSYRAYLQPWSPGSGGLGGYGGSGHGHGHWPGRPASRGPGHRSAQKSSLHAAAGGNARDRRGRARH